MSARPASARTPHLKEFIFTEKLGSGTYATVYKAYRKSGTRQVVAIKCISKSSLNRASTENLLTEIEVLKQLKHDFIVELKDFQWDDYFIYLIMEFCSGGDLSQFIRSKRTLPEKICKRFLQQIGKALYFMRSKNVAHLDLKPQNILLSSNSNPVLKLADFGFAQYLRGDVENTMLRGSPLYMAPEMINDKKYDAKADLWSVGVILYECLFGRAPYASKTVEELVRKVKEETPIEIPYGVEISSECHDLLLRLLQRDPQQRIIYDDFIQHKFLDIDHMPNSDSLSKAIFIVKQAVKEDEAGNVRSAVWYYCKALDQFVPAIKYETDSRKKQALRDQIKQYMNRAEQLKCQLCPSSMKKRQRSESETSSSGHYGQNASKSRVDLIDSEDVSAANNLGSRPSSITRSRSSLSRSRSGESDGNGADLADKINKDEMQEKKMSELIDIYEDVPQLKAAITIIQDAKNKNDNKDFEGAIEKFELGLEALMKIVKSESEGIPRKKKLQNQISQWMGEAEEIKDYLNVENLNTTDTSEQEEQEEKQHLSTCIIQ